jgi:hypothetical protein
MVMFRMIAHHNGPRISLHRRRVANIVGQDMIAPKQVICFSSLVIALFCGCLSTHRPQIAWEAATVRIVQHITMNVYMANGDCAEHTTLQAL